MFWNLGIKDDTIKELLNKDDVKLEEILDQSSISSAMRNPSNHMLFTYLNRDDIMEELLKYVFTDEYKDHPKYLKFAKAVITIFTVSKPFQRSLLENKLFMKGIQDFMKEQPSSRCCGHFARIIESIIYETKGNFLNKLNDIQSFLIKNITNIALKDLFVLFSTEFPELFNFNTQLIINLLQSMEDENCMFIVATIREIMDNDEQSKPVFDSEELIDFIFKNAIEMSTTHPLFATELFRLLKKFTELSNYDIVHQKYAESHEYQINCSFPYAVSVLGKLTPDIFNYFFDTQSCSQLIEAIYQSFISKTVDEQYDLVKSANLCERIKDNFNNSKTNARLSDMAVLINKNFKESTDFNQSFTEFVENEVTEHIKIRDNKFGGKIVSNNLDYEIEKIKNESPLVYDSFPSDSSSDSDLSSDSNSSGSDDEFIVPFTVRNNDQDNETKEEEEQENESKEDNDQENENKSKEEEEDQENENESKEDKSKDDEE